MKVIIEIRVRVLAINQIFLKIISVKILEDQRIWIQKGVSEVKITIVWAQ